MRRQLTVYEGELQHIRCCGNALVYNLANTEAEVKADTVCVILEDITG